MIYINNAVSMIRFHFFEYHNVFCFLVLLLKFVQPLTARKDLLRCNNKLATLMRMSWQFEDTNRGRCYLISFHYIFFWNRNKLIFKQRRWRGQKDKYNLNEYGWRIEITWSISLNDPKIWMTMQNDLLQVEPLDSLSHTNHIYWNPCLWLSYT